MNELRNMNWKSMMSSSEQHCHHMFSLVCMLSKLRQPPLKHSPSEYCEKDLPLRFTTFYKECPFSKYLMSSNGKRDNLSTDTKLSNSAFQQLCSVSGTDTSFLADGEDGEDEFTHVLTFREQISLVSLGAFLLQLDAKSRIVCEEEIIPYLLQIESQLSRMCAEQSLCLGSRCKSCDRGTITDIPACETFAFIFNTMLSDIASVSVKYREQIIQSQLNLMKKLYDMINVLNSDDVNQHGLDEEYEATSVVNYKEYISYHVIPVLIGVMRAFGRFQSAIQNEDHFLLFKLFPEISQTAENLLNTKLKTFDNAPASLSYYRSIVSKFFVSMLGDEIEVDKIFNEQFECEDTLELCLRSSIRTDIMLRESNFLKKQGASRMSRSSFVKKNNHSESSNVDCNKIIHETFFHKFTASFNQIHEAVSYTSTSMDYYDSYHRSSPPDSNSLSFLKSDVLSQVLEFLQEKLMCTQFLELIEEVITSHRGDVQRYNEHSSGMGCENFSDITSENDSTFAMIEGACWQWKCGHVSDTQSPANVIFPYHSSHTSHVNVINLVGVSMLREVILRTPILEDALKKSLQSFIRKLLSSGKTELVVERKYESTTADPNKVGIGSASPVKVDGLSKFRLNVKTNVACIDILIRLCDNETQADVFQTKLIERIESLNASIYSSASLAASSKSNLGGNNSSGGCEALTTSNLLLGHIPLLLMCIDGLGYLASKFPSALAKQSSECLRHFLSDPSPVLSVLQAIVASRRPGVVDEKARNGGRLSPNVDGGGGSGSDTLKSRHTGRVSTTHLGTGSLMTKLNDEQKRRSESPTANSQQVVSVAYHAKCAHALSRLLECSIFNLSRSLIIQQIRSDSNCVRAVISGLTTRLFKPDCDFRDHQWMLSATNSIVALGHVAVCLNFTSATTSTENGREQSMEAVSVTDGCGVLSKVGGSRYKRYTNARGKGCSNESESIFESTASSGEEGTKAVLKFLLQWFDSNTADHHNLDCLLVDQLGLIVISRTKIDYIYLEIMKRFKEIIREAFSTVVGQTSQGDRKDKYQRCSGAVINTLANIALYIGCNNKSLPPSPQPQLPSYPDGEANISSSSGNKQSYKNNQPLQNTDGDDLKMDFLLKMLEIFVNFGMEIVKINSTGTQGGSYSSGSYCAQGGGGSQHAANSHPQTQQYMSTNRRERGKSNLGVFIPILAIVMRRIEPSVFETPTNRTRKLFSDFWLYSVLFGFAREDMQSVWPSHWTSSIRYVARSAPNLTFTSGERAEIRQMNVSSQNVVGKEGVRPGELLEMKTQLLSKLDYPPSMAKLVQGYSFPTISYLMSILSLESFRIEMRTPLHHSLHTLFTYLEDRVLQIDKTSIYECILIVVSKLFEKLMKVSANAAVLSCSVNTSNVKILSKEGRRLTKRTQESIESMALILLVEFNNPNKSIRKSADCFLSQLVSHFPRLLWSRNVLYGLLNILNDISQVMCNSDIESIDLLVSPLSSPNKTRQVEFRRLNLLETVPERDTLLRELTVRCRQFIRTSLEWAPDTCQSHLLNYINAVSANSSVGGGSVSGGGYFHAGVALATDCAQNAPFIQASSFESHSGGYGSAASTSSTGPNGMGGGPIPDLQGGSSSSSIGASSTQGGGHSAHHYYSSSSSTVNHHHTLTGSNGCVSGGSGDLGVVGGGSINSGSSVASSSAINVSSYGGYGAGSSSFYGTWNSRNSQHGTGGSLDRSSRFMMYMSSRQLHMSTVCAMLSMHQNARNNTTGNNQANNPWKLITSDLIAELERTSLTLNGGSPKSVENHPNLDGGRKVRLKSAFHDAIGRVTASLILMHQQRDDDDGGSRNLSPSVGYYEEKRLLHTLTHAPLLLFNVDTLTLIVECWNWLLTATSTSQNSSGTDIETVFTRLMIEAWLSFQNSKPVGIFQGAVTHDGNRQYVLDPLAPGEFTKRGLSGKAMSVDVEPHHIWIRFIQERIEIAKYSPNIELWTLYSQMMIRSLPSQIGRPSTTNSLFYRLWCTVGARFRLLIAGMSILMNNCHLLHDHGSSLRSHIYATALDFFCVSEEERNCFCVVSSSTSATSGANDAGSRRNVNSTTLTPSSRNEDLLLLIQFWTAIHQDKKNIRSMASGSSAARLLASQRGSVAGGGTLPRTLVDSSKTAMRSSMSDNISLEGVSGEANCPLSSSITNNHLYGSVGNAINHLDDGLCSNASTTNLDTISLSTNMGVMSSNVSAATTNDVETRSLVSLTGGGNSYYGTTSSTGGGGANRRSASRSGVHSAGGGGGSSKGGAGGGHHSYTVSGGILAATAMVSGGGGSNTLKSINGAQKFSLDSSDVMKDISKQRWLILALLASEIERLAVVDNPLESTKDALIGVVKRNSLRGGATTSSRRSFFNVGKQLDDILKFLDDIRYRLSEKTWRENCRHAWHLSPHLAVELATHRRFASVKAVGHEACRLVARHPLTVSHLLSALDLFLTRHSLESDLLGLSHVLTWAKCSPIRALSLLCPRTLPTHPLTAQYAVRTLSSYPTDAVLFYIPQLTQATRYDDLGFVKEFVKQISRDSNIVAHQFIWNIQTNMFKDEEGEVKDPVMYDKLSPLRDAIVDGLCGSAQEFYRREFDFFKKITSVSGKIKDYPKGQSRKVACVEALQSIDLQTGCYLPSNPDSLVLDIDRNSGQPMQSAAKAPYLAKFKVRRVGLNEMEILGQQSQSSSDDQVNENENNASHPLSTTSSTTKKKKKDVTDHTKQVVEKKGIPGRYHRTGGVGDVMNVHDEMWQAAIFKVGDDCRQDMLALQIIELCMYIFKQAGLNLFLFPYKVVATSPGCGVIECVPDAKSRDQIGRKVSTDLFEYFKKEFGPETSHGFKRARKNFIRSMAPYSLIVFLLQIKDRHNGNIMIDKEGHIVHIDFGFMFESSPGGNLAFEPDMKLTTEFVDIMGGKMEAVPFRQFMQLCVRAYLSIRPFWRDIVHLVQLMLDTQLPCFRGQTIEQLRYRLQPNASELEAATYMTTIIKQSFLNFRTRAYDMLQYHQNQIPY